MPTRHPALPTTEVRPTGRPSPLWARLPILGRARVVDARLIRTERIIGTSTEIANIAANPAVDILFGPVEVAPGRWRVTARWVDRNTNLPSPRRFRIEGMRRAAVLYAWILGVPTVAVATVDVVWRVWGEQITHAVKTAATVAVVAAAVTAITWWWAGHGRNGCPGLHCQGCGR